MKNEFTAVLEPAEEGGYFAYCPEVPEANGQGETKEETLDSLREAISLVLEDRREQGLRGIPGDAVTTVLTVG
jgi:predicted RNase H-like HicB family nuclease|tara:strand:- start:1049 stop:1267 length:219 start_codon:yes stop_codon:yes gene_type:complete